IHLPFAQLYGDLKEFPSLQFGLEMALKDLNANDHKLFDTPFVRGQSVQPINGLIWMGTVDFMKEQVRKRLDEGFTVLKMKVGAVNFEDELRILKTIRSEYRASELELRVDANGAFGPSEALTKLEQLASLKIHSIEQPIQKGQWDAMASLCENTPLPIALDEELIGVFEEQERRKLIRTIRPQYIILKPSFIGGFQGSSEWIALAGEAGAGWWVTSALESNVGLSAIAQWNATLDNPMPSGLGTGSLYTNNFESPLYVNNGAIGYEPDKSWEIKI
ncbi:MAG: o-succinylbenzoate synthase, partial [Owenweeksia sp.]